MLWKVRVREDLAFGDIVEFGASEDGKLMCKRAVKMDSIKGMALRGMVEGELVTLDTESDAKDLSLVKSQRN
jgi:hypothetical protein